MTEQQLLFIPDRFDMLKRRAPSQLDSIIVPVDEGLKRIKEIRRDMKSAGRGAFLVLRGDSGCGKSTFLSTLGLFLEKVEVMALTEDQPLTEGMHSIQRTTADLRVIIVEGREALREVAPPELEAGIHAINAFLRSARGEDTLVVWPANADDLEQKLIDTSNRVGADALLGVGSPSYRFAGPAKEQYVDIAERTVAALNQGASLADLGVSVERAKELAKAAPTVGRFMGLIRQDLLKNQTELHSLLDRERCRMWVIVAAANDPEGDIAGLTRGALSSVDIERLLSATNANIVQELKRFPEKLGILGAVLDAKILHLPSVSALSIARDFAGDRLEAMMQEKNLSVSGKGDAIDRLGDTDVARAFAGIPMGTRTRGPKPGSNTQEAFRKLAEIASTNDSLLNQAVGQALKACGFVDSCETERDLGTGLTRRTDILCKLSSGNLRLEMMWRAKAGRADVANYTLNKLYNYGRAIGFLQ